MMNNETTIVLSAGPINYSNLPIGTNQSNAMIPVNFKPVIGWILDDLLDKNIRQAIIVLREQDRPLQDFLQRAYVGRMDLTMVPLREEGTIVQSLQAGLCRSPTNGLTRIILGDTLIHDTYYGEGDFVYVGTVAGSRRWCLAVTTVDGRVVDYVDKEEMTSGPKTALAGYYHLMHGDHLRACVNRSVVDGESELSDVLRRYGAVCPIQARQVRAWYDFGHIDNLVDARRRLLQHRDFNSLSINPVLNTITKTSHNDAKLQDELDWYLGLPDELKALTPRILSHQRIDGHLQIVQEYYGYPTLSELYVYGDLHTDTWLSILRHVLRIHMAFHHYPGTLGAEEIFTMYVDKTFARLAQLRRQDKVWEDLLACDAIVLNGRTLRNVPALQGALCQRARELTESAPISVIHGDFCFSNMLFDINNQIIRLIDPRGSFGRKGIYGDARYDIAKLRHSVCGLYDYLLADMFDLRETPAGFEGNVYVNGTHEMVAAGFDQMVVEAGYNLDDIRFVEGLLFVSMLPLHAGHPERQRMMYLTGLARLNEVL